MERTGVATATEVDTAAARLREQVVAADATVVPPLIGAWTRKPAPASPPWSGA
jgi:hypothetical protein